MNCEKPILDSIMAFYCSSIIWNREFCHEKMVNYWLNDWKKKNKTYEDFAKCEDGKLKSMCRKNIVI